VAAAISAVHVAKMGRRLLLVVTENGRLWKHVGRYKGCN